MLPILTQGNSKEYGAVLNLVVREKGQQVERVDPEFEAAQGGFAQQWGGLASSLLYGSHTQ
jgi:hypothetical protein